MKTKTLEERFCALLEIIEGQDWGSEKIAVVLGCSERIARDFCRNDLEIRRKNIRKQAEKTDYFEEKLIF